MTLLCAPAKKFEKTDLVDLIEVDKTLYDQSKNKRLTDTDWRVEKGGDIVSYHNYQETPELEPILDQLKRAHPHAKLYKIATWARSTLDALRMLEFQRPGVIGLCMGPLGQMTRICGPIFEAPIVYAPLREEDKNAPGQLLVSELKEIYHFHRLNNKTLLFGLIGNPVHRSPGHLFHNDYFRSHGINGLYLKMVIDPPELPAFFESAKRLKFGGLSVTAPLKEAVIPYLDQIDPNAQAIGAVNTIAFQEGRQVGYNTDGEAVLDLLGSVKNKRIVVLGAGGAARAIIYTAVQKKATVVIVNRTTARAKALAHLFGCGWSSQVPAYDILINATSASMPIHPKNILPHSHVVDIALYETEFLKIAKAKECLWQNGLPIYFQQALKQQAMWVFAG